MTHDRLEHFGKLFRVILFALFVFSSENSSFSQEAKDIPTLIDTALRGENSEVRKEAQESLIQIGLPAVPGLIEALKDEDISVRISAHSMLGDFGSKAIPALFQALKDEDENVRSYASLIIREIDLDRNAVPFLLEGMRDEDEAVRNRAKMKINEICFGKNLLDKSILGRNDVLLLIEALKDENEELREFATRALRKIGPDAKEAMPALLQTLKDENEIFQVNARLALHDIGLDRNDVPILIDALKDENEEVRKYAIDALKKIGPDAKEAIPALIEARDRDGSRYDADSALRKIDPPKMKYDAVGNLGLVVSLGLILIWLFLFSFINFINSRIIECYLAVVSVYILWYSYLEYDSILFSLTFLVAFAFHFVPSLINLKYKWRTYFDYTSILIIFATSYFIWVSYPHKYIFSTPLLSIQIGAILLLNISTNTSLRLMLALKFMPVAANRQETLEKRRTKLIEDLHDEKIYREAVGLLSAFQVKKVIPGLIDGLDGQEEVIIRKFAADTLREIGPKAKLAIPALTKAIEEDADEGVRKSAREAINKIEPLVANYLES